MPPRGAQLGTYILDKGDAFPGALVEFVTLG